MVCVRAIGMRQYKTEFVNQWRDVANEIAAFASADDDEEGDVGAHHRAASRASVDSGYDNMTDLESASEMRSTAS